MITVQKKGKTEKGWKFVVSVDGDEFEVGLGEGYWQRLTDSREEPEELVRRSFEFLLQREPKESILKEFELPVIQKYFPEFEESIKGD